MAICEAERRSAGGLAGASIWERWTAELAEQSSETSGERLKQAACSLGRDARPIEAMWSSDLAEVQTDQREKQSGTISHLRRRWFTRNQRREEQSAV